MPSSELQFLKYSFALGSIDEALKALEELKYLGDAADERGRPLWLSFFMSYSRPFGNNKGAGMISSSVVPEEYKEIHDGIIKMRNLVFAHTDFNAEIEGGIPMNQLIFTKMNDGRLFPALRRPQPMATEIPKIYDLTNSVFNKVSIECANALNSLNDGHSTMEPGRYRYDLSKTEAYKASWIRE